MIFAITIFRNFIYFDRVLIYFWPITIKVPVQVNIEKTFIEEVYRRVIATSLMYFICIEDFEYMLQE